MRHGKIARSKCLAIHMLHSSASAFVQMQRNSFPSVRKKFSNEKPSNGKCPSVNAS